MSNAFEFVLDDASVRRAVVEGVPETVIAAIYLLHERSVGEVAAKLTPVELRARHQARWSATRSERSTGGGGGMASLTPMAGSLPPSAMTIEEAAAHPRPARLKPIEPVPHRSIGGILAKATSNNFREAARNRKERVQVRIKSSMPIAKNKAAGGCV